MFYQDFNENYLLTRDIIDDIMKIMYNVCINTLYYYSFLIPWKRIHWIICRIKGKSEDR